MGLTTLKPRLGTANLTRAPMLQAKAGTTEMERGRAWMAKRERVALRFNYLCAHCGLVWRKSHDQIDHIVPREQGGSNDEANLQPLCDPCHKAKTKQEASARAGR